MPEGNNDQYNLGFNIWKDSSGDGDERDDFFADLEAGRDSVFANMPGVTVGQGVEGIRGDVLNTLLSCESAGRHIHVDFHGVSVGAVTFGDGTVGIHPTPEEFAAIQAAEADQDRPRRRPK